MSETITKEELHKAIEVVKAHLDQEWISQGCEENHAFGCASCQAVLLKKQLDGLSGWEDVE